MRQCRWMEFLEDYDFTLHYHHGKENVVADALSRKSQGALASIASREWQMLETLGQFGLQYREQNQGMLGSLVATPLLTGSKYLHKFITQLPKDYYLIPDKLHHKTC